MDFNKSLTYEGVRLQIMTQNDFTQLFEVANDSKIWDQHNDKKRCELEGFRKFFDTGIENSENCYLIFYKNELAGSTRYYEYDLAKSSLKIGYTFYAKKYWGTNLNKKVKNLMLDYAFEFVGDIFFDIWCKNYRSQRAVEKLGAKFYKKYKQREKLVFKLNKKDWEEKKS